MKKVVTFEFEAPEAKSVCLAGDFNGWSIESHPLSYVKGGQPTGVWQKILSLEPGEYEYRFIVDGMWQDDPRATELRANEFGGYNSVVKI